MLDSTIVPRDLLDFEQTYLLHPDGCFLQARDQHNKLIGVIGMMPYDYRFDYLDYKDKRTVEVARLFVEPEYRRSGLATKLFQALLEQAAQKGIEVLYLHTHPFLTGAFEYWQKQGFELVTTTMYGEFETLHMDRVV
jgi:GNAT superfamily N-acetyltransferase